MKNNRGCNGKFQLSSCEFHSLCHQSYAVYLYFFVHFIETAKRNSMLKKHSCKNRKNPA